MPAHNHHRHNHGAQEKRQLGEFLSHVGNAIGLTVDPPEKRSPRTITSVMYYTMEPTFSGSVAGYYTASEGVEEEPTPTPTPTPEPVETPESTPQPKPTPTTPTTHAVQTHAPETTAEATSETPEAKTKTTPKAHATTSKESSSLPSSIVPTKSVSVDDAVLLATETSQIGTPLSLSPATSTPTATSVPVVENAGMSGGAKAGMAIGIILGIAAIASLIFFCFRQRKKTQELEKLDDEKFDNVTAGAAAAGAGAGAAGMGMARAGSTKTLSSAPRVDVRPTTAFFMPNRASQMQRGQGPQGNGIQMTSQPKSGLGPQNGSPLSPDSANGANPFGNHAEAIDPVNAAGPSVVEGVSAAGVVMAAGAVGAAAARGGAQDQNAPVGAVIKGPVRSTSRGAQNKYNPNQAANGQGPFSDAARTDGGAQNTPQQVHNTAIIPMPLAGVIEESRPSTAPVLAASAALAADSPLYRVHLDFTPSMPDELRVRAGEIVRLLKEFDDGWCMCIQDDLSFEGVLPRTCISNRPIRRPQNSPPMGPNKGQFPPPGQQQRRNSPPNGARAPAMNPNGRNSPGPGYGPQYRPQQQGRPQQGAGPMSANGRAGQGYNSPGPQYRPQQGGGPPRNGPPGQARPMGPPPASAASPPRIQPLDTGAAQGQGQSVSSIAATFPLPGSPPPPHSPTGSLASVSAQGRPSSPEVAARGIPEVTVTAPGEGVAERPVERKPVGRKPLPESPAVLPGQAQ